jgi:hypothetical protein
MKPLLIFLFFLFISCEDKTRVNDKKLIVYIVVEQLSYEALWRHQFYFTDGFRFLLDEGFVFSGVRHEFGVPQTTPTHASLATGVYPNVHGMISDRFLDRSLGKFVSSTRTDTSQTIGAKSGNGYSPIRYVVPTLGDLLKDESKESKVFSLAGKARTSMLLGGKNINASYYFHSLSGNITTSSFFKKNLPNYLIKWNNSDPLRKYENKKYFRLRTDFSYLNLAREDRFPAEKKPNVFPHIIKKENFYQNIRKTPFFDKYLLETSIEIIKNENLGKDNAIDMISIGLSASDFLGHDYGLHSQEYSDYLMRLDVYLKEFLLDLDREVGLDYCRIIVTSASGSQAMPEFLKEKGIYSVRVWENDLLQDINKINLRLMKKYNLKKKPIYYGNLDFYITKEAQKNQVIKTDIEVLIRGLPYVFDVFEAGGSHEKEKVKKRGSSRFDSMIFPGRSPDYFIYLNEHVLVSKEKNFGTDHRSAYEEDLGIPLIFYGRYIKKGFYKEPVSSLSIPATIGYFFDIDSEYFQAPFLNVEK